jgi:hypothetical protein
MGKLIALLGVLVGVAVWFLLFVILGVGLGTSFIAGGCVIAAAILAASMLVLGPVVDAPLTASGLLAGIAAFVILEVVLSVPMWIGVVTGLGVIGIYDMIAAMSRLRVAAAEADGAVAHGTRFGPFTRTRGNGHDHARREPVGPR